jgi:hypothetical protein
MYSMQDIEQFLAKNFPATKSVVEQMWPVDRKELFDFLEVYISQLPVTRAIDYFRDLQFFTRTASHNYTNPWDVL